MSRNNPWSVQAIIDRIERERRQPLAPEPATGETTAIGYTVRGLWSCHTDPGDLTAIQAHHAMQLHLGCGVDRCRVRRRARDALVAAGRMVLDARATPTSAPPSTSWLTHLRHVLFGYSATLLGGRHALR
ncbi:hypothetical protein [Nocardia sp. CC227C]|uniref:hypothetical protein n=1 Tax=Nocardia sp. CC227C TaxID=3044562 RepID=UPI00278C23EF|nr:hypothetical protein [Nocardia sp. CC227C]